jgi:hypothetical protein
MVHLIEDEQRSEAPDLCQMEIGGCGNGLVGGDVPSQSATWIRLVLSGPY